MALMDYINGPAYRAKAARLEGKLSHMQESYAALLSKATQLRSRYGKLHELAQTSGEIEVANGKRLAAYRAKAESLEARLLHMQESYTALSSQHTQLRARYEKLRDLAQTSGAMEVANVKQLIAEEKQKLVSLKNEVRRTEAAAAAATKNIEELNSQVLVLDDTLLLESFALYLPKFQLNNSREYSNRLEQVRSNQKVLIKTGVAATGNMYWQVNGKKSEGKKLVGDMRKLLLRSFNNECDYCVDHVKFNNVTSGEKRIRQSFDTCNRLGGVMTVEISEAYLQLKLDELHLAHEFQVQKQREKEDARRVRENLREQQKIEQEIRAAREKIDKDRKHFSQALHDLTVRLALTEAEQDRTSLEKKIAEVESCKVALDKEEKAVDYREQNAKAGYVYVISNVGAFGEGVYKIGMTRRLEPMDRVDELGDASVPFWFDVHAMVFSANAPMLEAKLHERFASGRINKVNGRKEFFRADIQEIEAVIRENYDAVVEVVRDAPAEQYRESLRMALPTSAIQRVENTKASNTSRVANKSSVIEVAAC